MIQAFEGATYPSLPDNMGGCPTEQPPYFPRPLIGHEPCEGPQEEKTKGSQDCRLQMVN